MKVWIIRYRDIVDGFEEIKIFSKKNTTAAYDFANKYYAKLGNTKSLDSLSKFAIYSDFAFKKSLRIELADVN